MKLYQALATSIEARMNCQKSSNHEWLVRHSERIRRLEQRLPSGSGLDNGCHVDLLDSTGERIIILTSFHHMNEVGYYDGWTNHKIIVRGSLTSEIRIKILGRNKMDICDYLAEIFDQAMREEVELEEPASTTP